MPKMLRPRGYTGTPSVADLALFGTADVPGAVGPLADILRRVLSRKALPAPKSSGALMRGEMRWDLSDDTPGAFRGMAKGELQDAIRTGKVKSDLRFSHPSEGTSFADDIGTAESYANFGRTNPARTGEPNYVVRVPKEGLNKSREGYLKTQHGVPVSDVQRVIRLNPDGSVQDISALGEGRVRQYLLERLLDK